MSFSGRRRDLCSTFDWVARFRRSLPRGRSLQALRLTEVERARKFVPPNVRVVPVLPRRTIAVMYCARYGQGSTLSYSELAVAPALVESRGRIGFWISHIYVDDARSIRGGREIWTLPKQFASFAWGRREVVVSDGTRTLCRIAWTPRTPRFRIPLIAPVLVENARIFWPRGHCRLARCHAEVAADGTTPIAELNLVRCRHVLTADDLTLELSRPR